MNDHQQHRLHAIVEGRVQGVGFRFFVMELAVSLDLTGWVRNTWDGHVEVVAEGERVALERLFQALQRGPRMAYVTTVRPEWGAANGEFAGFGVSPSD